MRSENGHESVCQFNVRSRHACESFWRHRTSAWGDVDKQKSAGPALLLVPLLEGA